MIVRSLILLLGLCSALASTAQQKFAVNGRLKIEGGDLAGARAVVYRNGAKERTITNGLNKLTLELDLNVNYVVSFEKDGYVAKKIAFNTNVPSDVPAHAFAPFEFSVSLFKQYDNVNMVVFNQPVGIIRYEPTKRDFDYDTDYTKSIQSQLQQAMAEVEHQRKEEARNASAAAKRKAAEDKEKAREEAEARKQAEARAREEQARAEQQRQEAERARMAEKKVEVPPPPPPRPVVEKPEPVPPPRPAPVRVERQRNVAQATEGMVSPPAPLLADAPVLRDEELIVEPNKVVTVIRLERNGMVTEYRRVSHKWGDVFYFKNGSTCSRQLYEQEALDERDRLVDVVPRGKMDR